MAAPMVIKSNLDNGDAGPTGTYWQIDFTTVDQVEEGDDCNLDQMPIPMSPSTGAMVFDYLGSVRKGSFSGSRVDGDLNNGVAMSNADWITLIRGRLSGSQNLYGPYRLVKTSAPATRYPQETNYIYISRFKWRYETGGINVITYDLEYMLGV